VQANPLAAAALIPALAQLEVVTLLTQAMTAVNASANCGGLPGPLPERDLCCEPRAGYCVAQHVCYAPRHVIHPTPRYLPRPVIHPTPLVEPDDSPVPCNPLPMCPIAAGPQPPWKTLPWQDPVPPAPIIKIVVRQPDMLTRGTMIDFFC
jgi:hypothetical protein